MRLRRPLNDIFDRPNKVKVLRVLISPGLELTGREIALEAKINHAGCLRTLAELVEAGIVQVRRGGRAHLYRLRRENYLVERGVARLYEVERDLLGAAVRFLSGRVASRIVSAVLFGSYARGEETLRSDVDVLFLVPSEDDVPKLTEEVLHLNTEFLGRFGVNVATYVKSVREASEMASRRRPPMTEILKDGQDLFGHPFRTVLSHDSHQASRA